MRISDWSSDVCSSDLVVVGYHIAIGRDDEARAKRRRLTGDRLSAAPELAEKLVKRRAGREAGKARSEEHTSELQSLMRISYAVFCLKKKKPQIIHVISQTTHNQN